MSRTGLLLLLVTASLGAGCGNDDRTAATQNYENTGRTGTRPEETSTDPTNTAVNERDRNAANPTPGDQSMSEQDTKLTQSIRQLVMDDESLSMTAKNIKIIAIDGRVTLRGPVKSEAEKAAIQAKAEQVAGPSQIDNQLEIAPDK
ncbi:MAG TPA: BON domain-containing protein [Candidatus Udaeobacter sp.]|nr:BON domain-containing protein [Candidatus Udaeobacter sp.]